MTNTTYFHNTLREYYDSPSVSSCSIDDHRSPPQQQEAPPRVKPAASSWWYKVYLAFCGPPIQQYDNSATPLIQKIGFNPESENSDDSSGISSLGSIITTCQSEGGQSKCSFSKSFSFKELRSATKMFHNDGILGEGSFGSVFMGWIDENKLTATESGKGTAVAIKRLSQQSLKGHDEWSTDVKYLGKLYHPNLARLLGHCLDDKEHLLVYEFMPRGSLDNHLWGRDSSPLSWSVRMKIALGVAKGLAFLHSAAINVIHRDVKGSNILLDMDYNTKLSDFSLAVDGPAGDEKYISTCVMGTIGYTAPDYIATGHVTAKSDVYSFGVVLLEILSGRRVLDKSRPTREYSLVEWANPYLNQKRKIYRVLDSRLEGQYTLDGARKVAKLAHQCLSKKGKLRPNMDDVVKALEEH